jgi:hypothetical protein
MTVSKTLASRHPLLGVPGVHIVNAAERDSVTRNWSLQKRQLSNLPVHLVCRWEGDLSQHDLHSVEAAYIEHGVSVVLILHPTVEQPPVPAPAPKEN